MRTRINAAALAISGVLLLATSTAQAALVQFVYTGIVGGATGGGDTFDAQGYFGAVGTDLTGKAFTATYLLDTTKGTTTSTFSDIKITGSAPPPIISSSLSINGAGFAVVPNALSTADANGSTQFGALVSLAVNNNTGSVSTGLYNELTPGPFSLTTPGNFVGSGIGQLSVFQSPSYLEVINLTSTNLKITAVPLPPTAWLLLSSLAGFGLLVRHRPSRPNATSA